MLNVALVGCGRIAQRHSEILGRHQVDGLRLRAVCDTDVERAKLIANRYGVPFFADYNEMMSGKGGGDGGDIDVVSVLTPSGFHAAHTIELSKYGKHIIVEKPMALTPSDAYEMIDACRTASVKLFVVKQNRFNLPVAFLKNAVDNGDFGRIHLGTVRVRWCRTREYYQQDDWRGTWWGDGGVLANQAIHHIDLLQWLLGDVESVFAKGITALSETETEDTAIGVIKFASGAVGNVEATTATRPIDIEGSLSLLGEKGIAEIGGFAVNRIKTWELAGVGGVADADTIEKNSTNPKDVYGFGHKILYEHVRDCIVYGKGAAVDGAEGVKSVKLVSALYRSMETGKEVFMRDNPVSAKWGVSPPRRPPRHCGLDHTPSLRTLPAI